MSYEPLHPYPRYGLAAALVQQGIGAVEDPLALAAEVLDQHLNEFFLRTKDQPALSDTLHYRPIPDAELRPGKAGGQVAANGCFLAPHALTSDGAAANTVAEVRGLRDAIRAGKHSDTLIALKRSFAPLTAKQNAGRASMAEPKASLLDAALTAVTTMTPLKPAALSAVGNHAIIPDLPLDELKDFIALFREMQTKEAPELLVARFDPRTEPEKRSFRRPPMHAGNYPYAPQDSALGPVGLVGAIGVWARRAEKVEWAKRVLEMMAERPLYVVGYDGARTERFGHHLVEMALRHDIPVLLHALNHTTLFQSDAQGAKRWSDPTWRLFRRMAGRFLQFFDPPSFQGFFAFRAEYPSAFSPVFEEYFMTTIKLPPDLVRSARAYGAWLNRVAWLAAGEETGEMDQKGLSDQEKNRLRKRRTDLKAKALVQLESTALSTRAASELFARLNVIAGRWGERDAPTEVVRFMDAAIAGDEIDFETTKDLVMAFMRVNSSPLKRSGRTEAGEDADPGAADPPGESDFVNEDGTE